GRAGWGREGGGGGARGGGWRAGRGRSPRRRRRSPDSTDPGARCARPARRRRRRAPTPRAPLLETLRRWVRREPRPRRAPVEPAGSDLEPAALHLAVAVEGVASQLATVAALLVAAEGGARIEHVVAVDPHRAGANGACHPVRLSHVARPYPGGEAVGGVVPLQDGVVLVLEGNDGDDRAEDLL